MTIHTHVYLEAGGNVSASIGPLGEVVIEIRPDLDAYSGVAHVYVYAKTSPHLHQRLCEQFGLTENEEAPQETSLATEV